MKDRHNNNKRLCRICLCSNSHSNGFIFMDTDGSWLDLVNVTCSTAHNIFAQQIVWLLLHSAAPYQMINVINFAAARLVTLFVTSNNDEHSSHRMHLSTSYKVSVEAIEDTRKRQ